MQRVGSMLQYVGGKINGVAVAGVLVGILFVAIGVTPGTTFAGLLQNPPDLLKSLWVGPGAALIGVAFILGSFRFNLWSSKQHAIDDLSEELKAAVDLIRSRPKDPAKWDHFDAYARQEFESWKSRVYEKLGNRAFFTKADQIYFAYLGMVSDARVEDASAEFRHIVLALNVHMRHLREIIQAAQMRRR
jgi:hypothetical protein